MEERRRAHSELRDRLASLDDAALRALVEAAPAVWRHWGGSHRVTVDGHAVFVKRVPVTDRELADEGSTRNVFGLPLFYSYGVGSAGFGAFRELGAHERATELVLAGATDGFPLLYHHRVMVTDGRAPAFPLELDRYVMQWNAEPSVRAYIEARQQCRYELWLLAEALPYVVHDWFAGHLGRAAEVVEQLCRAATALNSRGIVHFDAHFGNALTDDGRFALCDFGLAMAEDFDLDDRERSFLHGHAHYDPALVVWCLCVPLVEMHRALSDEQRARADRLIGLPGDAARHEVTTALVDHAASLVDARVLDLDVGYLEVLGRHRDVVVAMDQFLDEIRRPDKRARFDDRGIGRLLEASGVIGP